MNKTKIFVLVLVFIILGFVQYQYLGSYWLNNDLISNIIVFFSIIFGFYITSLAIFVTSKYVADLYKTLDKNNPTVTLLHTLVRRYRLGLNILLASIIYLLFIQFVFSEKLQNRMPLSNPVLLPLIFIILLNFLYSYIMLSDLTKVIIQEAKNSKQ